jgi:DNA-binding response OmpR family regulator
MARILIVEDEPFARRVLARAMERDGHIVMSAEHLQGAMDCCDDFRPEIAIVDWILSDEHSGRDVILYLRNHCESVQVVIYSGLPPESIEPQLIGIPVAAILTKPLDLGDLREAVHLLAL